VALEGKLILDLGCGPDPISKVLRESSPKIVGIDSSLQYARIAHGLSFLGLVLGDGRNMPFRDGSFGFVLCNDVLEHVREGGKLIDEILRVLHFGGATYLQCANRFQIIEPHFLLPFLSWVPLPLADIYLRITGRGSSYGEYFPRTRKEVLVLVGAHRAIDLTYERALMKIKTLNIQSKLFLRIVSFLRGVLSDRIIAQLAEHFSVISFLVFND
jgi:SAM-dependent methyltransferase